MKFSKKTVARFLSVVDRGFVKEIGGENYIRPAHNWHEAKLCIDVVDSLRADASTDVSPADTVWASGRFEMVCDASFDATDAYFEWHDIAHDGRMVDEQSIRDRFLRALSRIEAYFDAKGIDNRKE